jgi:predicted nucleic acid-binding protein
MTKTLRDIPDQATVMLDTNIIVYALFPQGRYHQACKDLLQRGARNEVQLYLTVIAAADVIHRAMIMEFLAQGHVQRPAEAVTYLKQNPQTIQQLTRYKSILRDITQAKISILPLTYRDLHASKQEREQYGLLTNDSLLITVMRRERIHYLATNDRDFERVSGIAVRQPE